MTNIGRFSDNFDRADGVLSSGWTYLTADTFSIISNQIRPTTNFTGPRGIRTGETYRPDQYVKLTIAAGVLGLSRLFLRYTDTFNNYYLTCEDGSGGWGIYKFSPGSFGVAVVTLPLPDYPSPGDTIEFQAVGSTLRVLKNGAQVGTDYTDSDLTTGAPGLSLFRSDAGIYHPLIDNWESGDIISGTPAGVLISHA